MPFQFDNLWMSAWKGKQCICKREFAQKLQIYNLFQILFCAWGIIGGLVHSCKYRNTELFSCIHPLQLCVFVENLGVLKKHLNAHDIATS